MLHGPLSTCGSIKKVLEHVVLCYNGTDTYGFCEICLNKRLTKYASVLIYLYNVL